MPIVRVELWEGRSKDDKKKIAKGITKVLNEIVNCPPQAVEVLFTDVPKDNWAIGGELCSETFKDVK